MQGKYLEIMFNSYGQPVGAQITNYLLEKVSFPTHNCKQAQLTNLSRHAEPCHWPAQRGKELPYFLSIHQRRNSSSERWEFVRNTGVIRHTDGTFPLLSMPEAFGLQGPEAYSYTSRSNTLSVASIDDVKDFAETLVSR